MHIVVVCNRKGGTGKSTVAVNLAAQCAHHGQRVLLIDLDTQGHCAIGLGVRLGPGAATVHRLFVDDTARLSDAIYATACERLSLAAADQRFDHGHGVRNDLRLRQALQHESLAQRFDLVLIDTAPSLDALLMNALLAGTRVLVPYVPHHLSFEGVRQLVRALFPVMTRDNRSLKILGFLPNMAAEHVRQHRTVNANVGAEFGQARLLPAIRADIRLVEAMAAGQPVRVYAPHSRASEDFVQLAQEVERRLGGPHGAHTP